MGVFPSAGVRRPASIGWALLAAGLALPWLMPIHARPWTGFHADALMVAVALAVLVAVAVRTRGPWTFPRVSVVLVCLSLVPLLQYLGGLVFFAADAFLASVYLFGFALTIALGARIEAFWPGRIAPALFASFGVAALVSVAIALNQWLGVDQWRAFTLQVAGGGRAVANVGQPNELATLYVWALLAFWWAFRRDVVRGWLVLVVAILLLFGVAMTQSRMGIIAVSAVVAVALVHPRALRTRGQRLLMLGLFLWFLGCVAGWGELNAWLQLGAPRVVSERLVPGTRLLHWQLLWDAVLQRPLAGWGWQQVGVAQSALAVAHPATGEVIRSSHNVVLDLLVWNGLPLGLLLAAAIGIWYFVRWRGARTATQIIVLAILSVFLWHSLVEQPHFSAAFLVPVGLLVGVLSVTEAGVEGKTCWRAREGVVVLAIAATGLCVALVVRDYFRIESAWMAERLRAARIGSLIPAPLPDTLTLGHLREVLELGRVEPRTGMSKGEIEAMRRITYRLPGQVGMLKLARAQAMNGEVREAGMTVERFCKTHPKSVCERVRGAWSRGAP